MRSFALAIAALLTIIATQVSAQSNPIMPDYIKKMANSGAQVNYIGNDLGLDAWMTVVDNKRQYVYVTPNQEAYIVGILLNSDGELVTAQQIDKFIKSNPDYLEQEITQRAKQQQNTAAQPSPTTTKQQAPVAVVTKEVDSTSPSEQLYAEIQASNWVEIGSSSAPFIYAFVDPECPHCHKFINELREAKAYENASIRTRLIPVGIMGKDSLFEAAKLIESTNPQKAFFDHLDGDEFALPMDEKLNTQKVEKNMAIMQDWELDVTPFIIYRSKTNEVKIVRGKPKDLDTLLNDIK